MNDADRTQDRWLTTEQIANAGNAPDQQDGPAPAGHQGYGDDNTREGFEDDNAREGYADDNARQGFEDDTTREGFEDGNTRQGFEDGNTREGYYEDDNAVPLAADQTASGEADRRAPYAGNGAPVAADREPRASLLAEGELQSITARWKDIQAEFVDEPTTALREADELVAELMQRLATKFAAERGELEDRWSGSTEVSTEDLRQGLRRYRSFFERLLAA